MTILNIRHNITVFILIMERFNVDGVNYTLTRARKKFECTGCKADILPDTDYHLAEPAGAGLRARKYPNRYCQVCMAPVIAQEEAKERS